MSKKCKYCKLSRKVDEGRAGIMRVYVQNWTAAFIYHNIVLDLFMLISSEVDVDYGVIYGCTPPIKNSTAVVITHCPWCGRKLEVKNAKND